MDALLSSDHFHRLVLNQAQECVQFTERLSLKWLFFQLFRRKNAIFGDGAQLTEFYEKLPLHDCAASDMFLWTVGLTSSTDVWGIEWILFEMN
jgi:hypothetical protein